LELRFWDKNVMVYMGLQLFLPVKTGTVTKGQPEVTDVIAINGFSEAQVLQLAASVESGSEHPLGVAVVRGARNRGIEIKEIQDFAAIPGKGVRAKVAGTKFWLVAVL